MMTQIINFEIAIMKIYKKWLSRPSQKYTPQWRIDTR